jgi:hypothetical protein
VGLRLLQAVELGGLEEGLRFPYPSTLPPFSSSFSQPPLPGSTLCGEVGSWGCTKGRLHTLVHSSLLEEESSIARRANGREARHWRSRCLVSMRMQARLEVGEEECDRADTRPEMGSGLVPWVPVLPDDWEMSVGSSLLPLSGAECFSLNLTRKGRAIVHCELIPQNPLEPSLD